MKPASASPVTPPERFSDPVIPKDRLFFTDEEKAKIAGYRSRYPKSDAAVMWTLWLAQEKFGFLPPEVIRLTADTLDMPYAQAYGVATFYTQYFKKKPGTHVLDVCTCFSCQVVGGYDILHYLEEQLDIQEGETTPDGAFTLRQAECLGACGSAPMLQVTNGRYVHNLTPEKVDRLLEALRAGKEVPFTSLTLPQDETDLGGNRRTDVDHTEIYDTPPVAETLD